MRKLYEKIASRLASVSRDKYMHFEISIAIAFTLTTILKSCGIEKVTAIGIGFGAVVLIGIVKELWDKKCGEEFDFTDVKADVYGAACGTMMGAV